MERPTSTARSWRHRRQRQPHQHQQQRDPRPGGRAAQQRAPAEALEHAAAAGARRAGERGRARPPGRPPRAAAATPRKSSARSSWKAGEVRFHVHRGRLDQAASRAEEQRGRPGGGHRHHDRQRQPRTPLNLSFRGHCRRHPACASPCSPTCTATCRPSRPCSPTSTRSGVDEIWCLGDLVGYGAQPDECVALARERCDLCLAGNHDLVVTGELDIADFSLERRRGRAAGRGRTSAPRRSTSCAGCAPADDEPRDRPLPRQPARPGLGVRALDLAGRRVHGPDGAARRRRRPLARGALVPPRRPSGQVDGAPGAGRPGARSERGRVAAQPRRRGPAARRRPARRVAPARHRGVERRSGGASSTRSTRPPRRSRRPGLPKVLAERLYTGQ